MSSPNDKIIDADTVALNKKISEIKKKIQLAEGQKKAYNEEWKEEQKLTTETITLLKKEIKELTQKLIDLKTPGQKTIQKQPQELLRKFSFPCGIKSSQDSAHVLDLKVIDLRKQTDVVHDRYQKRQNHFKKLVEQYQLLLAYKSQNEDINTNSAETVEEDANRKLICHLENEIHRTSVQWMEAEHIRKKYRSIKASLMNDSEKFESSLIELEQAIQDQQAEINKLIEINQEALEMRDATKMILQRQEQSANSSNRARERQALDFRRLVEERKLELERLERKIFATGKPMVHQDSIGSSSGEPHTGKTDPDDPNATKDHSEMDMSVRRLLEATGASATNEILARFLTQREASTRLNYLRASTETEKKHLESQRDLLNSQLEGFRFADIKETEDNQEELEKLKTEIGAEKLKMESYEQSEEKTNSVITHIRDALIDLLLKLQEIDENIEVITTSKKKDDRTSEIEDDLTALISAMNSNELLKMLEEKLRIGMLTSGQIAEEADSGLSEDEIISDLTGKIHPDDLIVLIQTPSSAATYLMDDKEKPPAFPTCYSNLISGRATTQLSSTSPGQSGPVGKAGSDDEGEVPSRSYLKRQAQLIMDSKSRRKGGFRQPAPRRK